MDEHSLNLAQRAVAALETMADPGMSAGDWVALGVGLSQCLLIAWGLWMISKSNASRDAQNVLQQKRHEESMALQKQQHEENIAAQQQRHEEAMTAQQQQHEESILALKELIRRTAGKDA